MTARDKTASTSGRGGGDGAVADERAPQALRELAQELGVQTEYFDVNGATVHASEESLLAVAGALGVEFDGSGAKAQARAREQLRARRAKRLVDPVHVVWDGETVDLRLGGAAAGRGATVECSLRLDTGEEIALTIEPDSGSPSLPPGLPFGYHDLTVEVAGEQARSRIISAPRHAHSGRHSGRQWGVFLPMYALRSERDWGVGDLGSARTLLEHVASRGGSLLGSTPLLATFLDEPFEPSPYAPVSRRFWNEAYLDLDRLPELEQSAAARELVRDRDQLRGRARGRDAARLVDWRRTYAVKRQVIDACAQALAEGSSPRRTAFEAWRTANPLVGDYASFRADVRRRGGAGRNGTSSVDRAAEERYHAYAQWTMEEQLADLASATDAGLYLDLPLGVHADGFDRAHDQDLFVPATSIGAPPDPLAEGGQDWGLPPLHPERIREQGYDYVIAATKALFRHAAAVRIDHVMALHRLFWIPSELDASHGVYVGYESNEQWAIICLESHRTGCMVVGEDLGTVPPAVRSAMVEHDVSRMYVLQFNIDPSDERGAIADPPEGSLASINTHDTPTWAAFWERQDDGFRDAVWRTLEEHDLVDPGATKDDPVAVHAGALRGIASTDAAAVIANLEDMWGELEPQNVPGTGSLEAPNWVRRAARTVEQIRDDTNIGELMSQLTARRSESAESAGATGAASTSASTPAPQATPTHVRHDVSLLTDDDIHLFAEGRHNRMHRVLGSHVREVDGVSGTWFGVWAPNAERVSVIGDHDGWTPGSTPLEPQGHSGIWQGWVPELGIGAHYKYHIASRVDGYQVEKADPYARQAELPPKTASIVWQDEHTWSDEEWMRTRAGHNSLSAPMSVYEVHPGSWMRSPDSPEEIPTWRDLAPRLIEHVHSTGFTHVELMPVMEHPFYGSWGYQTTGYFAPSSRYGTPDDFRWFVDQLHQADIGVILDWVPSHFPTDQHGLGYFDGTHLYEHADPKQGFHPDWKSWIFNYSRDEVRSFLLSSAMYWLEEYHVDGLRVDAVASMLYLDYSRGEGEWVPNIHGGRENLEAIEFLRQLNRDAYGEFPDIAMIAEESTAWGGVSKPIETGGIGFGMKWDMGWMHDTLSYFQQEPIHRKYHQDGLTFRQIYAYTENFMLPLSHDEVVHGKGSLISKMPGDAWQQFANLRLLLSYMWTLPGKKLLFQGSEFAQGREWNHDASLDWHQLEDAPHAGILALVRDLNRLYRDVPALHELDVEPEGFAWVDASDAENSVFSYLRKDRAGNPVLVVLNATPVPRTNYRVGVPSKGRWNELFNSDSELYWGGGQGNMGGTETTPVPIHGHDWSLNLTLPPLACVVLQPAG